MKRDELIGWLRKQLPPEIWGQVWWLAPLLMLFMLPVGALGLRILGLLGWYGAARATQGLMLVSIVGGVVVGSLMLWCIDAAGLQPHHLRRAKWLARLTVVGPTLTLLIMFWITPH